MSDPLRAHLLLSEWKKIPKCTVPSSNRFNSGNCFGPHLHVQPMDSSDPATANGLPCAFEKDEVFRVGRWQEVVNDIPTHTDRICFYVSKESEK